MLRLAEIGLFLSPAAVFLFLRFVGPRLPGWLVAALVAAAFATAAGGMWFGATRSAPPTGRYVPAQLRDGAIVPGRVDPPR